MVTIYDIAKKTGYSISTVSKVLNKRPDVGEKTKKIINTAVEELGYFPSSSARTLSTKKSWTIGVVFVDEVGLEHPFFNAVIENFKKKIEVEGYDLLFASKIIEQKQVSYLDHFRYRGVDGVIVVCVTGYPPDLQELSVSDIPSVLIDLDIRGVSVVYSDHDLGSELAVNYLYGLGHRKIAHIAGSEKVYAGIKRLNGYIEAMKANQLEVPRNYIVDGGYFSFEEGKQAMEELLQLEDKPTAVYVAGDLMAVGAIAAIRERGLNVPDDISVIGFDDIQIAKYINPPLTTIRQDMELIGKTAANLLIEQINSKQQQHISVKIPVTLVERDTCKPLTRK